MLGADDRVCKQEDFNCDICVMAKMTRSPFPTKSNRKTELLELIHCDLCGPMKTESFGKSLYFITFIDDRSRWSEVKFLKRKSEALEAFKSFKNKVECLFDRRIKYLQTDNGGEFTTGRDFNHFLESCGIQRRLTVSHCPAQNGVAERKNRVLQEMTRCFLIEAGLPQVFWAEAVNTACYIRNRCPSRAKFLCMKKEENLRKEQEKGYSSDTLKHQRAIGSGCLMRKGSKFPEM